MYGSGKPDDNPFATSVGGPPAYRDELDEIALTGTSTGAGAWGSPGAGFSDSAVPTPSPGTPSPGKKGKSSKKSSPVPAVPAVPESSPISNGGAWGAAGSGVGSSGFKGRGLTESELVVRAAELDKREAELRKREEAVRAMQATGGGGKEKNWPRCRPILYHNIAKEVPPERRGLVTRGYIAWILEASGFIFGWIVVTLMFITKRKSIGNWLFCSLISVPGLPLSFTLWHRSLYFATITDGFVRWMWYFLWQFCQVGLCAWVTVGPPIVGDWSAGAFTMIKQFSNGSGTDFFFAIITIINMAFWGLSGLLGFWTMGEAAAAFRGRGPEKPHLDPEAGNGPSINVPVSSAWSMWKK